MKVCIIGTGYVGLVSGTCFSELGHDVTCIDLDETKIGRLRRGIMPIYEPGLEEVVERNAKRGRLSFGTSIAVAADAGAQVFFIAVGTPTDAATGRANVSYVMQAAEDVAAAIASRAPSDVPAVVVVKSTVPVGTNALVHARLAARLAPGTFAVASNPEFLREGTAVEDFMKPDRIVVGSACEKARSILEELYRPLTRNGVPMFVVDKVETAEIVKYAANAYLATRITFVNEVAALCEAVGADVSDVTLGMGADTRIGTGFLQPGPGYGGSCFPKDTLAIVHAASDAGCEFGVVRAAIAANAARKTAMVGKIVSALGGSVVGKRIAVLGLAFKAGTDDMRDAPALTILPALLEAGADIVAYDPVAATKARADLPGVTMAADQGGALTGADACVVLTEWPEFAEAGIEAVAGPLADRVVIDLRNVFSQEEVEAFDGDYHCVGRPSRLRQISHATDFADVAQQVAA